MRRPTVAQTGICDTHRLLAATVSVAASGRTHGAPVLNIAVIDATTAVIDYYVERQAGCASEYYTGSGEARGQWIGQGAAALGLAGDSDDDAFRRLMNGLSPDGTERLAKPVLRVHPRGKLAPGPLIQAVERLAAERAVPAADLLERGSMQAEYRRAERA